MAQLGKAFSICVKLTLVFVTEEERPKVPQDNAPHEEDGEMEYYELASETMKDLWGNEGDEESSRQYDNRLDLPQEKSIELPPSKSATQYYNEKRKEQPKKREESKKKTADFFRILEGIEMRTSSEIIKERN